MDADVLQVNAGPPGGAGGGGGAAVVVRGVAHGFDCALAASAPQSAASVGAGAPAVDAALRGVSAAVVVFGPPGSGKSHTVGAARAARFKRYSCMRDIVRVVLLRDPV